MDEEKVYYVDPDERSRYQHDRRIIYTTGESIIETSDRINFKRSNKDRMYTVEAGYENRLDLVSWKVYGSALYWWAIAAASGITDPFVVPVGTILTCPPIELIRGR